MKLRGIKFGEYHTADDWHLTLNAQSLDPAEPKTNFISIDGRDGDLDATEALTGEVKYNNREASFTFIMMDGTVADRENLLIEIYQQIHGRKLNIIRPDDLSRYLVGRCQVLNVKNNGAYCTFDVTANCEPWRYNMTETVYHKAVTSDRTVLSIVNAGRKTIIPELEVTGSVNIEYSSLKLSLETGTYKATDLILKTGTHTLTVYGSGELTVRYREAVL